MKLAIEMAKDLYETDHSFDYFQYDNDTLRPRSDLTDYFQHEASHQEGQGTRRRLGGGQAFQPLWHLPVVHRDGA